MVAIDVGKRYTRAQIQQAYGGGVQTYLPNRAGRVTCGCFDPALNPHAPAEILVGDGPNIIAAARLLVRQGGAIPIFLKRASSEWEYLGRYRVAAHTDDPVTIAPKASEAGRDDVSMLLELALVARV
jgi:hypothetical protein